MLLRSRAENVTASGGALSSRERHHAEGREHASLRHRGDRGTGTVPHSRAGHGGARGHRHHEDARQGRAAARGGRRAGGPRRAGSRGGDRGGARRRAGGDRARDDRAGGHAEPAQPRQAVRGHERAADPGDRQPAGGRGAGGHPPGHRAGLRGRRAGQAFRWRAEDRGRSARLAVHPVVRASPGGDQARRGGRAVGGAGGHRAALRRLLRAGRLGRAAGDAAEAAGAGGRRRDGVWSFVEVTDAAAATLAAVDRGAPGLYNVVDDDPAPVAQWLPYLAQVAGAKPPLRVPAWLGRLLAGEFVVAQMTTSRGYSNEKARKELGWEPRYASWREGFRAWVSG